MSLIFQDPQIQDQSIHQSPRVANVKLNRTPQLGFSTISFSVPKISQSRSDTNRKPQPIFCIGSAQEVNEKVEDKSKNVSKWRITIGNLLAGAVAGCAVEAALYPIDTIKTRLQSMREGGGFKALISQGGGKSLYAGVWSNLAGVAPSSAIFMAFYEPSKIWLAQQLSPERSHLAPLGAGTIAGLAASVVRVPTEVVKQRMQTGEFVKLGTALNTIITKEGVSGLYAGYRAFLLRDLPFDAIEFFSYEWLKQSYKKVVNRDLNALEVSVAGAVAGGFTGAVTTPFDVLKTRLMTQGASGVYKNVFDATIKIAQEEGAAAFFKGWEPRVMWISLGGCVFFTALEEAKKVFVPQQK
eukprot:TRINITY_DN11990_c0_g3_i2.p2 TRINITY_DN11990_c0_g3~~TRINITY_DN11990_c0_g3_i2.p2  ORF type:complete len:354 (+),score=33.87 TRINITY_DN11990_c0_g3_i2:112-1173(+)